MKENTGMGVMGMMFGWMFLLTCIIVTDDIRHRRFQHRIDDLTELVEALEKEVRWHTPPSSLGSESNNSRR